MSNNTREALAALPMLPEPFRLHWINCPFESIGLFTAEQMQAYARAALATQPAQPSAELLILRAEAEALRKALEWYAGRAVPSQHPDSTGHCDDGHFARKTLAALDATKGTT